MNLLRSPYALILFPALVVSIQKPLLRPMPGLTRQGSIASVLKDSEFATQQAGVRVRPKPSSGWTRIARAGSATPVRTAHSVFGAAALVFGTMDLIDVFAHNGISIRTESDALIHMIVFTIVAALSLPRARSRWSNEKPWLLWMPTARDAQVYISFVQQVWLTCLFCTDYIRPTDHSLFTMGNPLFLWLTWFNVAATLYTSFRSITENSDRGSNIYEEQWLNAIFVVFNVAFLAFIDMFRVLFLQHSPVASAEWAMMISTYPEWTQLIQASLLLASYFTSLSWFLSSAEHYKIVTKSQIGSFTTLSQLFGFGIIVAAAITVDQGRMTSDIFKITLEGICSFL